MHWAWPKVKGSNLHPSLSWASYVIQEHQSHDTVWRHWVGEELIRP